MVYSYIYGYIEISLNNYFSFVNWFIDKCTLYVQNDLCT